MDKVYKDLSYLHSSFDRLHSFKAQTTAYQIFSKYNESLSIWDLYSKLYYSHTNWKQIKNSNFEYYNLTNNQVDYNTFYHGNHVVYTIAEGLTNDYKYSDELAHIPEANEVAFADIVDMCHDAGVELLVTMDYPLASYEEKNAVEELTEKYGVSYVNIMDCIDEIGWDYRVDLCDTGHFNLSGTIKWTDYLGKYITEKYDFSVSNGKSVCEFFDRQRERLFHEKQAMNAKVSLIKAYDFESYLEELMELDKTECSIFISIGYEGTNCLNDNELNMLKELGLDADFKDLLFKSYAAAIVNDQVQEAIATEAGETANIEGKINRIAYQVVSGGANVTASPSIKISAKEYAQVGTGFNIVVYHNSTAQVISTVFFDTGSMENPYAERFTEITTNTRQMETEINVWETTE